MGGECSFYACMPSKALLRPGELLAEVRRIPGVREAVTGDARRARGARPPRRGHPRPRRLGHGALARDARHRARPRPRPPRRRAPREGRATTCSSARRAVVVATGSGALIPPIDGPARGEPWTNREVTTAKQVPARLAILGGGVVGVEMAQAWSTLGSQVTLIEAADRLIAREEPFAGEQVRAALRRARRGRAGGRRRPRRAGERRRGRARARDGRPVRGDELLVAVGRAPAHRRPRPRDASGSSPASRSRWTTSMRREATGSTPSAT